MGAPVREGTYPACDLALGASDATGVGALPLTEGYVFLIKRELDKRVPGVALVNLGVPGARVDLIKQTAFKGKKPFHLTAKEFAMLRLMAESPGEPISRERFLDIVWDYTAFPTTRTVDNHIASLRRKLEPNPDQPRWFKTVHGVGYKLEL